MCSNFPHFPISRIQLAGRGAENYVVGGAENRQYAYFAVRGWFMAVLQVGMKNSLIVHQKNEETASGW